MTKSKVFWVTRDGTGSGDGVEVWRYKAFPHKGTEDGCDEYESDFQDSDEYFCGTVFRKLTGITLKPGQKKKFRLVEG